MRYLLLLFLVNSGIQLAAQERPGTPLSGLWQLEAGKVKADGPRTVMIRADSSASWGKETVRWRLKPDSIMIALGGEWETYRLKLKGDRLSLSGGAPPAGRPAPRRPGHRAAAGLEQSGLESGSPGQRQGGEDAVLQCHNELPDESAGPERRLDRPARRLRRIALLAQVGQHHRPHPGVPQLGEKRGGGPIGEMPAAPGDPLLDRRGIVAGAEHHLVIVRLHDDRGHLPEMVAQRLGGPAEVVGHPEAHSVAGGDRERER